MLVLWLYKILKEKQKGEFIIFPLLFAVVISIVLKFEKVEPRFDIKHQTLVEVSEKLFYAARGMFRVDKKGKYQKSSYLVQR